MPLHDPTHRDFASDNAAGVHPALMAALVEANHGHVSSYGADPYTDRLRTLVADHFGPRAQVFPVFNGTGANIVALQAMSARWGNVICADTAHLHTDECAAPERHGLKLITVPAPAGKVDPSDVAAAIRFAAIPHHAQAGVLSLTQSTELGTCYTLDELAALTVVAHRGGLVVHVDGARIANAAAGLGVTLREVTTDVGVDVLSFGATKSGAMFGDCVIVLHDGAASGLPFVTKASTQLPSKARFISAQLIALLESDLLLTNAATANAAAGRLADGLRRLGLTIAYPVDANAVFTVLPNDVARTLSETYSFSTWDESRGLRRLMTAFDTTDSDVDALIDATGRALAMAQKPTV